ncbi:hypothetical protein TNCV_3611581 [Trichonephila clavipes]|nr:hypothetical protein TNCV_3611581 [Trichonephila clavipes]
MPHSSRSASCKDIEVCGPPKECRPKPSGLRYCNGQFLGHWRAGSGSLSPPYETGWVAWLVCRWPSAPKVAGSTSAQVGGLS